MLPTIGRRPIVAEAPSPKILAGFIQSVPELPYWQKWAAGGPPTAARVAPRHRPRRHAELPVARVQRAAVRVQPGDRAFNPQA